MEKKMTLMPSSTENHTAAACPSITKRQTTD